MKRLITKPNSSIYIATLIFCLLGSPQLEAETLMDVYRLALSNDATLQAAKIEYSAAKELIPQSRAKLLPELSIQAKQSKIRQNVLKSSLFGAKVGKSEFPLENRSINIRQPILNYAAWVRLDQAKISVKQANIVLQVAEQKLIMDVVNAFFKVLAAQDEKDYASAERKATEKHLRDVTKRNEVGIAKITDVYDVAARNALSESKEIVAIDALDDSYQALRQHTRIFILKVSPLTEIFPLQAPEPNNVKDWIELAIKQNISLEAKRLSLEVARLEVKSYSSNHYPTLDLIVSKSRKITGGPSFGNSEGIVDSVDAILQFKLNLYQGGGVQSRMRQAYLHREKAIKELESQRREIERLTRAAFRGVLSGIKKVKAHRQGVLAQKSSLVAKKKGFKAAINTLLEVLDAQQDLFFAKSKYSQARYDYLLSTLKLKQSAGDINASDLQAINQLVK